jgi:malonyl-CoA O-methyltransferase
MSTRSSDPHRVLLDPSFARRAFGRAGATYDGAAVLQTEVRRALLERLKLTALEPRLVLDAGAGTGHAARALKGRYPDARVLAVDWADEMLRIARKRASWFRPFARVCADAARLPLPDASVDLVFSNLMLPWSDPQRLFTEFRRVLAPRGFLTFSTLGPDTLAELRDAWSRVDAGAHVHPFIDMHDLGDALVQCGFAEPVLDIERYTLEYEDVHRLTADLKAAGEVNSLSARVKGLTTPRKMEAMRRAYEQHRRDGRLPATYEVVFGQAWAPRDIRAAVTSSNTVRLEDVRRQLKRRRSKH